MNHKRKRPKHQRAGCCLCKPWKRSGVKNSVKSLSPKDQKINERLKQSENEVE